MRNFSRIMALLAALIGMALPMAAATPSEFYASLLRRGVASYDANRYTDAAKQLRLAAFGLVETVDQYQLAQMYLTLTFEKLGQQDRAREAAHRVIVAERVERRYSGLTAPAAVRTAFEAAAARLLNAAEVAALREGTTPSRVVPQASANPPRALATTNTSSATPQTASPRTTGTVPAATAPPTTTPQTSAAEPQMSIPAPRTTLPEDVAPRKATPPPAPVEKPKPAAPKPALSTPPATSVKPPAATAPATVKAGGTETDDRGGPEIARPATATPVPVPAPPRALSASEAARRLAAAERALNGANLTEARRGYRELLATPGLDHDTLIRIAEGLYRARDFGGALGAFSRVGSLRRGEEPYRYYIAVAAYETGDFARARKELAAALPYIEITPDVARYRGRIESGQ
jgi:tetratricopeptide (TPR) repeat protein